MKPAEIVDDQGQTRLVYVRESSNNYNMRTVIDGALVAGIAALVGVVWNMSNNLSSLTAQISFMNQEIHQLQEAHK